MKLLKTRAFTCHSTRHFICQLTHPIDRHRLTTLAALIASMIPAAVHAQQTPPVQQVLITGNPLGSDSIATPASVLAGQELVLRRGSSLGETLDTVPGVSATYFGPNASRPIIRGQDGDRIRILSNAGASFDASSLSFDHAVPIDPLVVERLEVLRGPAALLYGGSAVGGVVNAIDNRIPRAAVAAPGALSGAVEAKLGGAADERSVSGLVETGGSGFVLHADGFRRRTSDLRVPAFERPVEGVEGGGAPTERSQRIVNSASEATGGAVGGSLVGSWGYLGAGVDTYRNDYGIVAEDDVTIRMKRDRVALAGEWRNPGHVFGGLITTVRGQVSGVDYDHEEVEGSGAVGTTFKNRGAEGRLEAVHRAIPLGNSGLGPLRLEGTVGLQGESSRFSALGEEAFVPNTHTRSAAAFVVERFSFGGVGAGSGHIGAGLRTESVRVESGGDADGTPRFGAASKRSFSPRSGSIDGVVALTAEWQLSSSLSWTERAPTSYELYADGVHAATGTYERGDRDQSLERGRNVDLAVAWKRGANRVRIGAYHNRFTNYIVLDATGEPDFVDEQGGSVPIFAFRGVPARLYGFEAEGTLRVLEGARNIDIDARFDSVSGINRATGEPLPRLSPRRAMVGVNLLQGSWTGRLEVQRAQAQRDVPSGDVATSGYTLVNLSASYALNLGRQDLLLYAKLQNLGDTLAFSATTVQTLRGLAPLPGRSLLVGARLSF